MRRDSALQVAVCRVLISFFLLAGGAFAQKVAPVKVDFRFVSAFGQKGNGQGQFHDPSGIAVDPVGSLYVADTGNDRIQNFDLDGDYLSEVGGFGWDAGRFNRPVGVAVGRGGLELYVADGRNNRIQIFSPHFRLLGVVGGQDVEGPVALGALGGIAVSQEGELYVSDTDADQMVQISTYNQTDRSFGGYGYGAGRLRRPLGLAVGGQAEVYVCDSENDRIAVFDRFGNFKRSLGEGTLSEPAGVCAGVKGTLFVADTGHHRVLVFDLASGEVLRWIGGPDPGQKSGTFKAPRGLVLGPRNVLYVLDTGNSRVQKFQVLVPRR